MADRVIERGRRKKKKIKDPAGSSVVLKAQATTMVPVAEPVIDKNSATTMVPVAELDRKKNEPTSAVPVAEPLPKDQSVAPPQTKEEEVTGMVPTAEPVAPPEQATSMVPVAEPSAEELAKAEADFQAGEDWRFPTRGIDTAEALDFEERQKLDAEIKGFGNIAAGFQEDTFLAQGYAAVQDNAAAIKESLFGADDEDVPTYKLALQTVTAAGLAAIGWNPGTETGEPDYDKDAMWEELTDGIPSQYKAEIMGHETLAGAIRERNAILKRLDEQRRAAAQEPGSGALRAAGSFIDIDAPLALMTGGIGTGAKAARAASEMARSVGLGMKAQRFVGSTAMQASSGAQAALLVEGALSQVDPTYQTQQVILGVLGGAALGGGIGGVAKGGFDRLMRDEYEKLIRNDPVLKAELDIDAMPASPVSGDALVLLPEQRVDNMLLLREDQRVEPVQNDAMVPDAVERQSIGAARNPNAQIDEIVDPMGGAVSETTQLWNIVTEYWRRDSGYEVQKKKDLDTWAGKLASAIPQSFFGNSFATKLWTSKGSINNWIGANMFESSNGMGRGKFTAATAMDMYQRQIMSHVRDVSKLRYQWSREKGNNMAKAAFDAKGTLEFNRLVMLERNARAKRGAAGGDPKQGGAFTQDKNVNAAADAYGNMAIQAHGIMRGQKHQRAVDGAELFDADPNYQQYRWSGKSIIGAIREGRVTRAALVSAMADAYRLAGMNAGKDADAVADAVLTRAIKNEEGVDVSMGSLITRDGAEFLNETLEQSGISKAERDGIMKRLLGDRSQASREEFAKRRNDIDLEGMIQTTDGSEMRIVDLLSQDLEIDGARYARQVAGASALARIGVTNRAQRKELIEAARAQARALGEEPVDAKELEAMMSNFDGGGIKGYSKIAGGDPAAAGQTVALVKKMSNLAFLGKLGLTQLGETAASIVANGLGNWWNRGPGQLLNAELKKDSAGLRKELEWLQGELGFDQGAFKEHVDLDSFSDDVKSDIFQTVNAWASTATYIQGYTSFFNPVRSGQQVVSSLAVTDKVFRTLREVRNKGDGKLTQKQKDRFWNDLGIDDGMIVQMNRMIDDGTIQFADAGYVKRVNFDKWEPILRDEFASTIVRSVNQVVQRSLAGEADAWMHTAVGSLMTHLKTFPMAAVNKGVIRNMRHMDKEAMGQVMFGLAMATTVAGVRATLDGTISEKSAMDIGRAGFSYSNLTGWLPTYYDPVMTLLGMDNLAFNPYASQSSFIPPSLSWADGAWRIIGETPKAVSGYGDAGTRRAMRSLPFANTVGVSNIIAGIGK